VGADRTSLEIDEVMLEDSGDYCVMARNAAGDARTCCRVDVIAALPQQPADAAADETSDISPPGFTYVFQDFTADVGQPCTVRVTVSGNPHPKVYCFFYIFCIRCDLLLRMWHVAWSACLSVCWSHGCALQKRLN